MVDGTLRISRNFGHLAFFGIDQNPATPVTHTAMALNNGIVAVNFHFAFSIGISEINHSSFPR
jgi:hypothetical protein